MTGPKLTVCIPAYNSARYIAAAVESVLMQSFTDFELLVIDDRSTDGTREIVFGYAGRDPRVICRENDENLGMVENWNQCLRLARGEYVRFLFGDDLLASGDALARMVEVLDRDRDVSLVASARNTIDADSRVIGELARFQEGATEGTEIINRCLVEQKNLIGEPSVVMFRREQARRGFDLRYRQLVDLEMWFHLLEKGSFAYIGEPLTSFRVHKEQQTTRNVQFVFDDRFLLYDCYLRRPYVRLGAMAKGYLVYAQNYCIWKLYRNNEISREYALERITARCPAWKFFLLIPWYKLYSPWYKLRKSIATR
jgi:glycosyltransferase involved in cell wall biosynthesis